MAVSQVPNNLEDTTVLRRFLTDLVIGLDANPYYTGNIALQNKVILAALQANPTLDFMNLTSKLVELRTSILKYIEDEIETVILQNKDEVAVIAEQFGTFYEQALAASWYGLSVKAGGVVSGLEIGSLDPDVTTPGDESSYFRVSADNFIVGKAYEDLSQSEKDYLNTNNLPSFGTVYNASKQPIPALAITWDSINQVYKHYFNGVVSFNNMDTGYTDGQGNTVINGGQVQTNSLQANRLKAAVDGSTVWEGGALISANFNGNAVGNIGNPSSGFRLSSNGAGSSTDPNIYGAYIKGSTIDASTLIVTASGYPNNSGKITYFQKNNWIYMPGYGSGFLANRVCSYNSFVKLEGWYRAATNNLTAYLQYSLDGANYTTIISKTAQQYGFQEYFYIYFSEIFNLNLVGVTGRAYFRIIGSVAGDSDGVLISIYNN